MEVRAYLKSARLSPQKACLVADMVRGLDVDKAIDVLSFSKQKGAALIKKLLDSAISNAENNDNADIDDLKIKSIVVNSGRNELVDVQCKEEIKIDSLVFKSSQILNNNSRKLL